MPNDLHYVLLVALVPLYTCKIRVHGQTKKITLLKFRLFPTLETFFVLSDLDNGSIQCKRLDECERGRKKRQQQQQQQARYLELDPATCCNGRLSGKIPPQQARS